MEAEKELKELKERHQSLLEAYKIIFQEKKELEEKIEFLKLILTRESKKN